MTTSNVLTPSNYEELDLPLSTVVDDAELLSILACDPSSTDIHAHSNPDTSFIKIPPTALLDWDDWNQDVPDFLSDKKRKHTASDSDDDDEDFNFLDQFEFVDVTFDDNEDTLPDAKKQKTTFVNENAEDLSSLLQQSDALVNEHDYRWVLDITS
ncbi:hypothetical protein BC941DRAFT_411159 [Chlamydoabsidia padenii]|nr:hypothetical protein BC941DRAFT_411159 [Chlamydoabsidia padenii]